MFSSLFLYTKALSRARKSTKRIEAPEDLDGFEHLGDSDQKIVLRCIKGERPPEGGGPFGGNAQAPKPATPKKESKPKSPKKKADGKLVFSICCEKHSFTFPNYPHFIIVLTNVRSEGDCSIENRRTWISITDLYNRNCHSWQRRDYWYSRQTMQSKANRSKPLFGRKTSDYNKSTWYFALNIL